MSDMVNHPAHYTQGNIEVADFIDDQKLDWKEASIIQYVCRWRKKNGVEDLLKARWYINRLINENGGVAIDMENTERKIMEKEEKSEPTA